MLAVIMRLAPELTPERILVMRLAVKLYFQTNWVCIGCDGCEMCVFLRVHLCVCVLCVCFVCSMCARCFSENEPSALELTARAFSFDRSRTFLASWKPRPAMPGSASSSTS